MQCGHSQIIKDFRLGHLAQERDLHAVIEVEVQNETHQSQLRMRFAAVPRIGEGIRLREPNGFWASYDVLDVWYQQAEYGEIWLPYLHVRMTPSDGQVGSHDEAVPGQQEFEPFKA